jgi:hypothetical protein
MSRGALLVALALSLAACGDAGTPALSRPSPFATRGAATGTPSVTVFAAAGGAVAAAHVEAFEPNATKPLDWRLTGDGGVARLSGLDATKRYRLVVTPTKEGDDLLPEELDGWTPTDTWVHLSKALTISGTVVGADGKGYPNPAVFIRGDETLRLRASSSSDREGRFTVKGLRAGQEIEIAATNRELIDQALAAHREPYHPGVWTVHKAGDKNVVIVVDLP